MTQALTYEVTRNDAPYFTTIHRHAEELQRLHGTFFPYRHPHENILEISEEKLKKYTWEIFEGIWKSKLVNSRKGITYKGFKDKKRYEPFLDQLNRKLRRVLLKFRLSDHKLMVEEGRHFRPQIPRENRWCKYCKTAVEDEQHMLIDCQLYGNRSIWFEKITEKFPNFSSLNSHQKFTFQMTQEDEQLTKETAEKISEWFNLRELIFTNFF